MSAASSSFLGRSVVAPSDVKGGEGGALPPLLGQAIGRLPFDSFLPETFPAFGNGDKRRWVRCTVTCRYTPSCCPESCCTSKAADAVASSEQAAAMVLELEKRHKTVRDQYLNTTSTWKSSGLQISDHMECMPLLPLRDNHQLWIQDVPLSYTADGVLRAVLPWKLLQSWFTQTPGYDAPHTPHVLFQSVRVCHTNVSSWSGSHVYDMQLVAFDKVKREMKMVNQPILWVRGSTSYPVEGLPVEAGAPASTGNPHTLFHQEYRKCLLDFLCLWSHLEWKDVLPFTRPSTREPDYVVIPVQDDEHPHHARSALAYWILQFLLPLWIKDGAAHPPELSADTLLVRWTKQQPNELEIKRDFLETQWNAFQDYLETLSPFVDLSHGLELRFYELDKKEKATPGLERILPARWNDTEKLKQHGPYSVRLNCSFYNLHPRG